MSNQDVRIGALRSIMVRSFPMFGILASDLRFYVDKTGSCPTFAINKYGQVIYSEEFSKKLTTKQLLFVMCHEAMHYALEYFARAKYFHPKLGNIAHDYVVNLILNEYRGLELPDQVLLDEKYKGWSLEEVYADICDQCKGKGGGGKEPQEGFCGGDVEGNDEAFDGSVPDAEKGSGTDQEIKEKVKRTWQKAIQTDKEQNQGQGWGCLPNNLKKEIEDLIFPKITFAEKLKQFYGKWGRKSKNSFVKSNRRNSFQVGHMLRPGKKRNDPKVFVLIDTSGSMFDNDDVRRGLGAVLALGEQCGFEVECITCDTQVADVLTVSEVRAQLSSKKGVGLGGWGGSDFRPAFEKIWQENWRPSPILVFTDGYIDVPEKCAPGWGVYWVVNHGQLPTQAWGEKMEL